MQPPLPTIGFKSRSLYRLTPIRVYNLFVTEATVQKHLRTFYYANEFIHTPVGGTVINSISLETGVVCVYLSQNTLPTSHPERIAVCNHSFISFLITFFLYFFRVQCMTYCRMPFTFYRVATVVCQNK